VLTLSNLTLPADGTYKIRIRAATGQTGATGNYFVAAYDVTADVAPLLVNHQTLGNIDAPFNADRWTLSLQAGQQIRLDLIGSTTSHLQFTLNGPDGYQPFANIGNDSELITIPAGRSGEYILSVKCAADQTGAYSFALRETRVVNLAINTTYSGTLAGSGAALLFKVTTADSKPLFVQLNDSTNTNRNEIYLKRGAPPTRADYDFRYGNASGADQSILVPSASQGDWYILVYGDYVPAVSSFTLRAVSSALRVTRTTPDRYGQNQTVTMTISGAGFLPGTNVKLIPTGGGKNLSALTVSIDTYLQITATFDLNGVPIGIYDLRVTHPSGDSDTVANAFTVTTAGEAILETRVIAPEAGFGRHGLGVIYVEYANTGDAAMPAPLLQLRSADQDGSDRLILTLDQSLLSEGFWTNTLPAGFANEISILASGEQPGLLNPGESVRVPVYYAGLQMPWDFGDNQVELGLSIIKASDGRDMNWAGHTYAVIQHAWSQTRRVDLGNGTYQIQTRSGVNYLRRDRAWSNGSPPSNAQLLSGLTSDPNDFYSVYARYDQPGVGLDELRPAGISPTAWNAIVQNLQGNVGSTLGSWVRALSANAQALARMGIVTNNIADLWGYEVLQAMGSLGPVQTLDAVTDAAMPTPGVELSLSRSFSNGIVSRYSSGPFGQGWSMGWDLQLSELPGATASLRGSVVLSTSTGSRRVYEPDGRDPLNSKYFSPAGDTSTLRKLGTGVFELRDVSGNLTRFRADGKIDYVQDPNGNRVSTTITGGRLHQLTHSNGAFIQIFYSGNRIERLEDSAGRITSYGYDATNTYLKTVTTDDGKVTTYTYNQTGVPNRLHALRTITRGGVTQTFNYDSRGRLDDTYRGANQQLVDFIYDSTGKVNVADAEGTTQLFYDHHGLLTKVIDPLGNLTVSSFDEDFRLKQIVAPTGESQRFTWTTLGQLGTLTDELGNTTNFDYGTAFNRLTSFTDARGSTTSYGYDANGNLKTTTYANNSVERLDNYTADGLPQQFTNRRGQAQSFTYTAAGQVDVQTFADGSSVDFDYDTRGNLDLVTERSAGATPTIEVTDYQYSYASDGDRLKKVLYPNSRWIAYTYDSAGRRESMSDSTGASSWYEYDAAGRLWKVRSGSAAGPVLAEYRYKASGRLERLIKGNGTYTTYDYDAAGQLRQLINYAANGGINSRFDYTYDARGRRDSMTTLEGAWTYGYDATGQLTSAIFAPAVGSTIPAQNMVYVYDALGNRDYTIINGVTVDYGANNLNQYSSVGGTAYRYDTDGNLTFDGERTYEYDTQNRLTRVTGAQGVTEYEYDALGNRTASVTNGVRTEYLLDPTGLVDVTAELDAGGNVTARNVYGLGLIGRSVGSGGSLNYFDFDALGSTASITSSAGQILNRYVYEPFGGTLFSNKNVNNPFEFVGQFGGRGTSDAKLLDLGSRSMTPAVGRFTSIDPIQHAGGDLNVYGYALNQPTQFIDSRGQAVTLPLIAAGATIGAAANATFYAAKWISSGNGSWTGLGTAVAGGAIGGAAAGSGIWAIGIAYGALGAAVTTVGEQIGNGRYNSWEVIGYSAFGGAAGLVPPSLLGFRGNWGAGRPGAFLNSFTNILNGNKHGTALNVGTLAGFLSELVIPGLDPIIDLLAAVVGAWDPNDKIGPKGVGPQNLVRGDATLPYKIRFENIGSGTVDPTTNLPYGPEHWATAPAQRVTITDQLSPLFDWSSFRLTEMAFGGTIVQLDRNSSYHESITTLNINSVAGDPRTIQVQLIAGIDLERGLVFATFQSLDPFTGLPPDVLVGFLPPENGTGRGKGYFSYTIQPKAGLATGTQIRNVALISFDNQTIIATNQSNPFDPASADPTREALITIDNTPPAYANAPTFNYAERYQPLTFRFAEDVRGFDASDLLVRNLTTGAVISADDLFVTYDPQTFTVSVSFGDNVTNNGIVGVLPDGRYEVTLKAGSVTDLVGNPLAADQTSSFSFLLADFDNNGAVIQFDDLLILAQNYGRTSGVGYREGDANFDGAVNFDDLLIVAQKYGSTLPTIGVQVSSSSYDASVMPHSISFGFNLNVGASLEASDLQLRSLTSGQTISSNLFDVEWDPITRTAKFVGTRLSGGITSGMLPDGRYRATLPAGSVSAPPFGTLATDVSFDFTFMAADFDNDATVGFSDLLAMAQHYGQSSGVSRADGDANYDGKVDFNDLLILAQCYGSSVLRSGSITPATGIPMDLLARYFPAVAVAQLTANGGKRRREPDRLIWTILS
jgi:RHS repeat-associated protein